MNTDDEHFHINALMRALIVVYLDEVIKLSLLLQLFGIIFLAHAIAEHGACNTAKLQHNINN